MSQALIIACMSARILLYLDIMATHYICKTLGSKKTLLRLHHTNDMLRLGLGPMLFYFLLSFTFSFH